MDNDSRYLTAEFTSDLSKNLNQVVNAGAGYSIALALQLDSSYLAGYLSNSNGSKRKCSLLDWRADLKQGSSLVLGLGPSCSSCTSITSGKEIDDESSVNLGLSINPHLGIDRISDVNNISSGTAQAPKVERSKLDLELSLSTAPAESDVTNLTQGSTLFQITTELQVTPGIVQRVDEGSTSSRWKLGPLLPPLQTTQDNNHSNTVNGHINPAQIIPNLSLNTSLTSKSSVAGASGVSDQLQHHKTNVKTCRFQGCTRGARGASGLCIAHGGGRRCQRAGCQKGAEGKTVFCKAHGGGRRCQHLGCTKSAEGRTDFCIGHGGGRRCSHEGCARAARGKSGLCIRHGGGKRCKMENCIKSAEGISGLCISHGGGRRCQYPACSKGAQGSTMFCKAHGGGKRCTFPGCTKGAEGSTAFCKGHGGGKRCTFAGGCTKSVHGGTLFCVNHGGGKRCASPGCTKSARGRTNFCVRHGGGKRCKFEGCGKSAQGSTDFCKAHGGGKRCTWGQMGSMLGGHAIAPCDKFARGKSGLCAAHSAQVQDRQMHDVATLTSELQNTLPSTNEKMKGILFAGNGFDDGTMTFGGGDMSVGVLGYGHQLISMQIPPQELCSIGNVCLDQFSLPEGRVHGGSLMAMLRGSTSIPSSSNGRSDGGPSEPGKSLFMTP